MNLRIKDYLDILIPGVKAASAAILEIYNREFQVYYKSDHSPVTDADKVSSDILVECLEKTGENIISEEASAPSYIDRARKPVWLVDPLDGTKEFIKRNDEFCIAIARVDEKGKSEFGLIVDVVNAKAMFGGEEYGTFISSIHNFNPLKIDLLVPGDTANIINSHSRLHPRAFQMQAKIHQANLNSTVLQKGSALKFFDLANDVAHIYPRFGPTMEWDIASGQAIYEGVGGEVLEISTFESLRYNKKDLFNPGFIAKPKHLSLEKFYE